MPAMSRTLMSSPARSASTTIPIFQNRILGLRCFCSSASSSSNSKLFVGGLSWSVEEKSLKDAFDSFGECTTKTPVGLEALDLFTFLKEEDAVSAKHSMDGKALLGRPLRISSALEKVRGATVGVLCLSIAGDGYGRGA